MIDARPKREARKPNASYIERSEKEFRERVKPKRKKSSPASIKRRQELRLALLPNEPLMRASTAAADWGWKGALPSGEPLCPLYYGCPPRPDYFCCERHRQLWIDGRMHPELMPAESRASAPEPPWVGSGYVMPTRRAANEPVGAAAHGASSGGAGATPPRRVGMASWVRGSSDDGAAREGSNGGNDDADDDDEPNDEDEGEANDDDDDDLETGEAMDETGEEEYAEGATGEASDDDCESGLDSDTAGMAEPPSSPPPASPPPRSPQPSPPPIDEPLPSSGADQPEDRARRPALVDANLSAHATAESIGTIASSSPVAAAQAAHTPAVAVNSAVARHAQDSLSPHAAAQRLLASRADCLLCRACAVIARAASHENSKPFRAPVDVNIFPDYTERIARPMDLRTIAERLVRGLYPFGTSGNCGAGADALRRDVELVWSNCRAFNLAHSPIVKLLPPLEATFAAAWAEWIDASADDGWRDLVRPSAAPLVLLPRDARLPAICGAPHWTTAPPRAKSCSSAPPAPLSSAEIAALDQGSRHALLELALPGRAPPPPGWHARDVGGVPWHTQPCFSKPAAVKARNTAEKAMRAVLKQQQQSRRALERSARSPPKRKKGRPGRTNHDGEELFGLVVTFAVGRRVVCQSADGSNVRYGKYEMDGRVHDELLGKRISLADFSAHVPDKPPLEAVRLEGGTTLNQLKLKHGISEVPRAIINAQNDPHCLVCGGGESCESNEILLCDGLGCDFSYHQQCCKPPVLAVPENEWLCPSCVATNNQVDPEVLADAKKAEEVRGGEEKLLVVGNDGILAQDIDLLREVLEVIDASLPLIGRVNAAKVVFAPDHQTLVLARVTPSTRRVLGAVVLKPHAQRSLAELAYCVVRKEEQRSGIGMRLLDGFKKHCLGLGILHLLTYADDSAVKFFEKAGFDPEPPAGMEVNRFHWAISHYIGSQLRQCALDPDGATLYAADYPYHLPPSGARRLSEPKDAYEVQNWEPPNDVHEVQNSEPPKDACDVP